MIALAALVLVVAAYRWLGAPFPWSQARATPKAVTAPGSFTSPTPVDMYDVMGTLTLNGRSLPSARLAPGESNLLGWIDDSGLHMNEIRPAEGWPTSSASLPDAMRGVAVVHALLVPPSTVLYDVVPLAAPLNASVCATGSGGRVVSYRLKLAGRSPTIDYADALYFATYGGALMITTNGDAWNRLQASGAASVLCVANA